MQSVVPATVFVNPAAGGGCAGRKVAEVSAGFARRNYPAKIVEPDSAEELRRNVRAAVDAGCTTLIAVGGDGTLQVVASEAVGREVRVGVIPAGGGNDFAAALGIHRDPEKAVEVIVRGNCRAVDVVRVRTARGEALHHSLYLGGGGMGLDAEAVKYASGRFLTWRGRLRYMASAIAALRGFCGIEVEATVPDSGLPKIAKKVLIAAVLNTPTYGGGLRLAPQALVDDGMLDVVMIEMMRRREVLALIPRLLATGELSTRRVVRLRAATIRLSAPRGTSFHGDGELLGETPVEIQVVHKGLQMLVP
ncbi:MAG TPA: YegS/Rv2252/BmrU family lipid kinase [Candidatus Acidoferrum sp.]|jgi:diacylglycerol kinase (ATP)